VGSVVIFRVGGPEASMLFLMLVQALCPPSWRPKQATLKQEPAKKLFRTFRHTDAPGSDIGDDQLDSKEVAGLLGVARNAVYRWIKNEGLPARKVGGRWKFARGEVLAWQRKREGR